MKLRISKTNRSINKVFWPKKKMENIREKFKTAKEKIKKKTERDFYELSVAIRYGDRDYIL
jgi:heterodisulfide reductase subunit B